MICMFAVETFEYSCFFKAEKLDYISFVVDMETENTNSAEKIDRLVSELLLCCCLIDF